jgi:lipopolysaccharide export system protein LptA
VKFFTIISFFILSVSPVLSEENIKNSIESDEIEYLNETGELKALGSVKITREDYQLEADEVSFDQKITLSKVLEMLLSKKKVDQLF